MMTALYSYKIDMCQSFWAMHTRNRKLLHRILSVTCVLYYTHAGII